MNKIRFFICVFFVSSQSLVFGIYYPIKRSGLLPENFQNKYFEKANEYYKENKYSLKYGDSNYAREYYYYNQYFLRELILSGEVIYGDIISISLQNQANQIVEKLHLKITPTVYLLRSTEVNAYATQTGAIFMTTALISHLDNYYELIYILCHELSHVVNDDLYEEFIDKRGLLYARTDGEFNKLVDDYYEHSVDCELRADAEGYQYYTSMNYPQEMAISALQQIDSSDLYPFFKYSIDSSLSLDFELPGLVLTKKDVGTFEYIIKEFEHSTTHPIFLDRFDTLLKQRVPDYDLQNANDEDIFSEFKTIATNETLYAHFLEDKYFMIIAFYHLANFKSCDKEFVQFLYSQSLYALLKTRLFIEKQEIEYKLNNSLEKYDGPLDNWFETLTPYGQFVSAEKPFVRYFRRITTLKMWSIVSKSILKSYQETDYVLPPVIFEDCQQIFDSISVDSLMSEDEKISYKQIYQQLEECNRQTKSEYQKKQDGMFIVLRPYITKPKESIVDQTNINYEYFDQVIFENFVEIGKDYFIKHEVLSPADIEETDKLNRYILLNSVIQERRETYIFETFASTFFDDEIIKKKKIRFIKIFQKIDGPLALVAFDINFETGEIENYQEIEMRTSEDTKGKIRGLIKKYYKLQFGF